MTELRRLHEHFVTSKTYVERATSGAVSITASGSALHVVVTSGARSYEKHYDQATLNKHKRPCTYVDDFILDALEAMYGREGSADTGSNRGAGKHPDDSG